MAGRNEGEPTGLWLATDPKPSLLPKSTWNGRKASPQTSLTHPPYLSETIPSKVLHMLPEIDRQKAAGSSGLRYVANHLTAYK